MQLLSQETAVSTIIPFLLELGDYDKALDQAIASGDPDLSEASSAVNAPCTCVSHHLVYVCARGIYMLNFIPSHSLIHSSPLPLPLMSSPPPHVLPTPSRPPHPLTSSPPPHILPTPSYASHPLMSSPPPHVLPTPSLPPVITVLLDLRKNRAAEIPYKLLSRPEADALYKKVCGCNGSCDLVMWYSCDPVM